MNSLKEAVPFLTKFILPEPNRTFRAHLLGHGSEQTGRVPRDHLAVQTQTGQVLVHVHEVLLQAFLHPAKPNRTNLQVHKTVTDLGDFR